MALRILAASVASALAVSAVLPASAACTAGQVDTSFGPASSNGCVQVSPWNPPVTPFEALAVGGDNKVYVGAALVVDSASSFAYEGIMRSSKAGALDRTYGGAGSIVAGGQSSPPPAVGGAVNCATDASGRLVAVNGTAAGFSISRFLADGTPDVSYGTNGVTQVALTNPFWFVGIVTLADGSAIIGTSAKNPASSNPFQALFVKLTPAGALDASFGSGGLSYIAPAGIASNAQVRMTDIGLLSTGDIVGIGRLRDPGVGAFFQGFSVKIHPDGSLDGTYGTGGFSVISLGPSTDLLPRKMVVQPDNQVVAGGSTQASDGSSTITTPTVIRFHANGSWDTGFGTAGLSQFLPGPFGFVTNITLQANNKIVASTDGTDSTGTVETTAVVRLTTTGQLDPPFGTGGSMTIPSVAPGSGPAKVIDVKASGGKIFASLTSALNASANSPLAVYLTAIDQGTGAGCR